jgi:hypothetical protein
MLWQAWHALEADLPAALAPIADSEARADLWMTYNDHPENQQPSPAARETLVRDIVRQYQRAGVPGAELSVHVPRALAAAKQGAFTRAVGAIDRAALRWARTAPLAVLALCIHHRGGWRGAGTLYSSAVKEMYARGSGAEQPAVQTWEHELGEAKQEDEEEEVLLLCKSVQSTWGWSEASSTETDITHATAEGWFTVHCTNSDTITGNDAPTSTPAPDNSEWEVVDDTPKQEPFQSILPPAWYVTSVHIHIRTFFCMLSFFCFLFYPGSSCCPPSIPPPTPRG